MRQALEDSNNREQGARGTQWPWQIQTELTTFRGASAPESAPEKVAASETLPLPQR
jgi:hypothetical protein